MILVGPYLMGAALLVLAGAAKAARPADTARALRQVVGHGGVATWSRAVRIGATVEIAVGLAGAARPGPATAALVCGSYVAFGAFVVVARWRGGPLATCGCFGTPDTPPTLAHLVIDALAALAAVVVAVAVRPGWLGVVLRHQPWGGVPLLVAAALATWLAVLVLVPLGRLDALRRVVPVPR